VKLWQDQNPLWQGHGLAQFTIVVPAAFCGHTSFVKTRKSTWRKALATQPQEENATRGTLQLQIEGALHAAAPAPPAC